jgi:hypothetical protein
MLKHNYTTVKERNNRMHPFGTNDTTMTLDSHGNRTIPMKYPEGEMLEVLDLLGCTEKYFIEFGSAGVNDNCMKLWQERGWSGLLIEAVQERYEKSKALASEYPVQLIHAKITRDNINDLFAQANVPDDIAVMNIDIDGMDYWIWKAIDQRYRPRLVVIEYNSYLGADRLAVMPYSDNYLWNETRYMGSSLLSITTMANQKGYQLIGCDKWGSNAFYVRQEDFPKLGIADNSVKTLFSPWNCGGWNLAMGDGPYVEV